MKHLGTKLLETNRLILRKYEINDYKLFYKNWASDERVTKYLTWNIHNNEEETKNLLKLWIEQYNNKNYYHWVIVNKEINEPIGSIAVVDMDEEKKQFEIGYCLGYNYWNKGFATETLKEIIKYLFNEVGVNCIKATHDERNIASGKVMLKCGMKYIETINSNNKGENIQLKVYKLYNNEKNHIFNY